MSAIRGVLKCSGQRRKVAKEKGVQKDIRTICSVGEVTKSREAEVICISTEHKQSRPTFVVTSD